jgi:hypothetical protein
MSTHLDATPASQANLATFLLGDLYRPAQQLARIHRFIDHPGFQELRWSKAMTKSAFPKQLRRRHAVSKQRSE